MIDYFNTEIRPYSEELADVLADKVAGWLPDEQLSVCCDMRITESGFCTGCWEHA